MINLILKKLCNEDMRDLFKWRNHPEVRKNSLNSEPILWQQHQAWFSNKINDSRSITYIAYYDDEKIGSIRFDEKEDLIKISVMVNPDYFEQGFGSKIIRSGTEKFIKEKKINKPLIAEIKRDNIASIKAFQKAGFKENYLTFIYEHEQNDKNC